MTRSFTADDAWLLAQGTHRRLWEVIGAHPDDTGATFRVWAPNASAVAVVGDRNGWDPAGASLEADPSGVWRAHLDGWAVGDIYKFRIVSADGRYVVDKADPLAFAAEEPPRTASRITDLGYRWHDAEWLSARAVRAPHELPMSIYEVHLGSWRYEPGGYRALGRQLADYCTQMGFTHVELMPVTEHPFYGSWGYQTTGYFAATSRYGTPQDLMAMIDQLHQAGVGVILDWVPSHFPADEHALGYFDGTHLYEHADPRQGYHPDWGSLVFNYERNEVRSFLLSSASFWLDVFHIDGIRVDAVASMLYLDYSRAEGEWIPNAYGGKENLAAISLLQEFNRGVYADHPGVVTIAEESTAFPGVTRPTHHGGLGFGFKWDMGWMHDTLEHFERDPVHRGFHIDELTKRTLWAWSENYVLPLSHDEVVHGKGSLLGRMPGDHWQRLANLRLLLGHQWTAPGKKLLFMGAELAQPDEWHHEEELPWGRLVDDDVAGIQRWIAALNNLVAAEPALHASDHDPEGFRWIVGDDRDQAVLAHLRLAPGARPLLVVLNLTPVPRPGYRIGVPEPGSWTSLLNSDEREFGGSGLGPSGPLATNAGVHHGYDQYLEFELAPLAAMILGPAPPKPRT